MNLSNMQSWLSVADGVNSFQGKKTGVVKQLKDKHAPRVVGVHCMVRSQPYFAFALFF